jgi:hypothetical protein
MPVVQLKRLRGLLLKAVSRLSAGRFATAITGIVLAAIAAGPVGAMAEGPLGSVGLSPAPAWVRAVSEGRPRTARTTPPEGGSEYLLVDEQYDVATMSSYFHSVTRIHDIASFEGGQNLKIDFDPAYQRLEVHSARLRRAGGIVDLLARQKFRVIQREENLESDMYDARLTALLLMEDLRSGDTLEYAYTLRGQNPVFGGRYMESLSWQYGVPVQRRHASLRVPAGRSIDVRPGNGVPAPETLRVNGVTEYHWSAEDLPAVEEEDDLPSWFEPYAGIDFSEFHQWKDVAEWGRRVYTTMRPDDAALRPLVDRLRREHPDRESYAVAALQFVQDEIRYYGVEMGEDSHRPTAPSEVLRQRFGDCKDKAVLLCALLAGDSVRAEPVLVDTYSGERLDPARPWPLAFDHVVVRVGLDGRDYFVDPTVSYQRGGLAERCISAASKGLVIGSGPDTLVAIPPGCGKAPSTRIDERYIVSTADSAVVEATTRYEGSDADDIRSYLATESAAGLEQGGRHFYASEYRGVRTLQALKIVLDDTVNNAVVVSERYAIDSFRLSAAASGAAEAGVYATAILNCIGEAPRPDRKMPFGIPHPVSGSARIVVEFPDAPDVDEGSVIVDDPAFSFSSRVSRSGNVVEIGYEYASRRDWVPPGEMKTYAANVARARESVGVVFRPNSGGVFGSDWTKLAIAAVLILGGGYAVRRNLRS